MRREEYQIQNSWTLEKKINRKYHRDMEKKKTRKKYPGKKGRSTRGNQWSTVSSVARRSN